MYNYSPYPARKNKIAKIQTVERRKSDQPHTKEHRQIQRRKNDATHLGKEHRHAK